MKKHYLLFASLTYAYPILRPLQKEIRRRGDIAAWFLEDSCPDQLEEDELRLRTFKEVKEFNPVAVFAPGDWVYDFFPGLKVRVCHGYPIYKRGGEVETHFRLRGWFDIHCTQGDSSTIPFKELEHKHPHFKAYETGWSKVDSIVEAINNKRQTADATQSTDNSKTPTIFVATTFTKRISSLSTLYPTIKRLAETKDWNWVITKHPKLQDEELISKYTELANSHDNVKFYPTTPGADVMIDTDVMLCDASSIILEYMMLDKPVVTFRNTTPGDHIINVEQEEDVEQAIEQALTRPQKLMNSIRKYIDFHERHRDGRNCARILDAVDDFILNHKGKIKRKPLNLFRKLKLRWRLRKTYFPFLFAK